VVVVLSETTKCDQLAAEPLLQ